MKKFAISDTVDIFNLYFYTVFVNEHFMMLFGIKNGAQNVVLYRSLVYIFAYN